ncbi:hypothetical protein [Helicobacter sp. 13S00477-4]|uniref:hypothetical protein n=1 Tax=Helicobacter sp. 13S00477-4 TaxID=1905759 RepID=UPI000BA7246F|nr:hypothetical protein [Helicobacter sp. 13S00477-4]PAF50475.1 hypothetical protein BKH44_08160 [Helicobacter sp. 13S00477-4]
MTRIDIDNNIIEIKHSTALEDAYLLLSYAHQQEPFKDESPEEFIKGLAESYEIFLQKNNIFERFRDKFKEIKQQHKNLEKEFDKAFKVWDVKKMQKIKKELLGR